MVTSSLIPFVLPLGEGYRHTARQVAFGLRRNLATGRLSLTWFSKVETSQLMARAIAKNMIACACSPRIQTFRRGCLGRFVRLVQPRALRLEWQRKFSQNILRSGQRRCGH